MVAGTAGTNYLVADFGTRYSLAGSTPFELHGTSSNQLTGDSVQVSIPNLATSVMTDAPLNIGGTISAYNTPLTASVIWSDKSLLSCVYDWQSE